MGFLDAVFDATIGGLGSRLQRESTAHSLAASRVWAWDCELVTRIVSTYDPLPETAGVEHIYAEVARVLCDDLSFMWRDPHAVEQALQRELESRSRGERVDSASVRSLARRLATEYRHHVAYLSAERTEED